MRTFLICGGGTGGHLYPALALLQGLRRAKPDARLVYVGSRWGLETRVLPQYPWIEFYTLSIRGIARPGQRPRWALWALFALAQIPIALAQALFIVLKVRPTAIIGFGGYGAFAPLLWGVVLRIPIYIHEQNFFPGLVTRLFAPWAKRVFLTYPGTARYLKARYVLVTGVPIRPEILSASPDPERFGLRAGMKTALVFGGSRGSTVLTEAAIAAQRSCPDLQFLIVTGEREPTISKQSEYIVFVPYIHEMGVALATADVVICRAGAATLAELAALDKPAIIVPWPLAAGDHQAANANQLAQKNFILVPESELTPGRLVQEIKTALHLSSSPPAPLPRAGEGVRGEGQRAEALHHILREVFLDATSTRNTPALYRDRRRRHEWAGQSLF